MTFWNKVINQNKMDSSLISELSDLSYKSIGGKRQEPRGAGVRGRMGEAGGKFCCDRWSVGQGAQGRCAHSESGIGKGKI